MPYIGKKPADIIATAVDTTTGTFSGEVDAASLDISGNIDVDGTTNLDVVDIDGAVDMASTLTVAGAFTSPGIDDNADATAITISSDEDVMIGTTDESSGAKFIVGSTDDDKRAFIQGSNQYRLGLKNGSNNHVWLGSGGADNFRVSNSSGSTLFEINSSGNIVLPSSNAGIHLGVSSATASNLLDDYEEGTWTPVFVGSSGGSATYSQQIGRYTKIGNRVHATCYIVLSGNSLSGTLSVSGLPYASASISQLYHSVSTWINTTTNGNSFDGDFFIEGFLGHNGSTSIFFYSLDGDGVVVSMMAGDITASTDIMINFTYQTN